MKIKNKEFSPSIKLLSWIREFPYITDLVSITKSNLDAVKAYIIGTVLNDYDASGTSKKGGYYCNYSYHYKNISSDVYG